MPGRVDSSRLREAQISVDDKGIIEQVRISRDTEGRGFPFSRCAEVFGS